MPKKSGRGRSSCDALKQKMLVFDHQAKPVQFLMPDQEPKYRSFLGAIISLITILLVISYAFYKITDLIEFNSYDLQESE